MANTDSRAAPIVWNMEEMRVVNESMSEGMVESVCARSRAWDVLPREFPGLAGGL